MKIITFTAPFFFLSCTNLPDGWEDATRIEVFDQAECITPDPELDGLEQDEDDFYQISGAINNNALDITYLAAEFRCSQSVEGFHMVDGNLISILVQPIDMKPRMVAKCGGCQYDIEMSVPVAQQDSYEVEVYHRTDAYAGDPTMELVDSITLTRETSED